MTLYEKLLYKREGRTLDKAFSEAAVGARKNRSTIDQWFTIRAIFDCYRYFSINVYLIFPDLEKAFDKLRMKDALLAATTG